MTTSVYLKIAPTGKIETDKFFKGNCQITEFKEWIEITEYSHSFEQAVSAASRSSDLGPTARCTHNEVNFNKFHDNSTDDLINACWIGQCLDLEIGIYRTLGNEKLGSALNESIHIQMKRAYIKDYTVNLIDEEGGTESLQLIYNYIEYKFTQLDFGKGKLGSTKKVISWDWATNEIT
jgi:type VI secretion system Hcp family effector